MMSAKTCAAALMGEGGGRCCNGNGVKYQVPQRPHIIINEATLTVIGNRAAQQNVAYKSAGREERHKIV